MPQKFEKHSRAEINKHVRRIFAKYHVDLSSINFMATRRGVLIKGTLLKQDGSEFNAGTLVAMIEDLSEIGAITTDLTNWDLNARHVIKKQAQKIKKKKQFIKDDAA